MIQCFVLGLLGFQLSHARSYSFVARFCFFNLFYIGQIVSKHHDLDCFAGTSRTRMEAARYHIGHQLHVFVGSRPQNSPSASLSALSALSTGDICTSLVLGCSWGTIRLWTLSTLFPSNASTSRTICDYHHNELLLG